MSKIVEVHEACVITKDDKGNLSLVGKAKEALTSMSKHKVSVSIILCDNKKEDVEKFLNDNEVPFTSIRSKGEDAKEEDGNSMKADVMVMPGSKVVTLDGDWQWCLDRIVQRLWGEKKKEAPKSEQQRMDAAMDDYIKWAKPQKKTSGEMIGSV